MIGTVIVWAFMVIVCTIVAAWSAMLGLLVNMDRGGIHPAMAGISGAFILADVYLLFHAPFYVSITSG